MATLGQGLTSLIPVAMTLVGIVTVLRARRARRSGERRTDPAEEERRAATAETERRMAAYLASRDSRN